MIWLWIALGIVAWIGLAYLFVALVQFAAHADELEERRRGFDPWWGDRLLREAEAERLARQQDAIEAQEFQDAIDAAMRRDPPDQAA